MTIMGNLRGKSINAACKVARVYLNAEPLNGIGEVTALSIDIHNKTVTGSLKLVGETDPLDFSVGEYDFFQDRHNRSVKLKGLRTSKAWVNGILEKTYPDGISIRLNVSTYAVLSKAL